MTIDKDKLKALIAECRYGVSGKGPAIEVANDLLGDCCDNLESLLAEIERLKGLQPSLPPRPPEGYGLPRFGLRWNGPSNPLAVSMDDGYWTPWHLADELKTDRDYCKRIAVHNKEIGDQFKSENEQLRKDAERHRWLRQHEFDIGSYHGVHEHNHAAWFEHIDDEAIDRSIAEEAKFADDNGKADQEPQ